MRICPYCLRRFPDDAPGCPRCDIALPPGSYKIKGGAVGAVIARRQAALPNKWILLAGGGAVLLIIAIIFGVTRLAGGRSAATPRPVSSGQAGVSAQASAAAGFPTPPPPSGWQEWLVGGNHLKLWLPDTYQVVNFSDLDWQTVYASKLNQDAYLRSQSSKAGPGSSPRVLLAGVSGRGEQATVRVTVIEAPALAGSARPKPQDVQPLVDKLGLEGDAKNVRNLTNNDFTCDPGVQLTQVEIIPPKLDSPNAWRGFAVAVTRPDDAFVMFMLVNPPRNLSGLDSTIKKALGSLCGLPAGSWATPTPTPSSTPSRTPTPTPTLTSSPTPKLTTSPTPAPTTSTPAPILTPGTATPSATVTGTPPTPTASATPTPRPAWLDWRLRDRLTLQLPRGYAVVNLTDDNWQTTYQQTLGQNRYLRDEANKVKLEAPQKTWLLATSPSTSTVAARVSLVVASPLAGAERPLSSTIQAIVDGMGIKGKLAKVSELPNCGAMLTRAEIAPLAGNVWGGAALAITSEEHGYLLVVLFSPPQLAEPATLDKILNSVCFAPPSRPPAGGR